MLRTLVRPASLTGLTALLIVLLMAVFPAQTLESSLRGLSIWWQVLFPALFPFFVISELLLGFGIVHFFGKLLDPLMRPLFRLPGIGSFVVTMGYVSGYPVGARLTAQLWEQGLVKRAEGERLVAFTTTSDPIFLIGAVAVGFFHNAALAPILAAAHYGGAFIIGLLMRFHDRHEPVTESPRRTAARRSSRLFEAIKAMHDARLLDGRSLGKLLQDSIQSALRLMIVVGGLVVFFSVVMELLTRAGIVEALAEALRLLFGALGLPAKLADASIFGLFEVTLGAKAAGGADTGLMHQTAVAAWILSWGGLSVHAQVLSLLSRTDLRYLPLMVARLAHGFIAVVLVYVLWGWLAP
ncbi:sporulation integral membrane protein YlbJ [Paenibacillus glycanilyticus]|uniref:Sporulation integral membrane protein YlbJ n=1 Tax=Paenibacillus glycanilyticus TaxID=126569 RepID=A0ABQ6GF84_9BACL|nr:sporulation integral membrane protein YlbJ [Paenibacillus glycanilyticus]GLX67702.1 sporulation integral membrane protein YlbJ [Paenibacillus glycanilyticus]